MNPLAPTLRSSGAPRLAALLALLMVREADAGAPAPASMPVRVVAFEDADPTLNCEPLEARAGACVERVRLLSVSEAWSQDGLSPGDDDLMRLLGHLYTQVWDDLATRWNMESDALVALYQEAGVSSLPATGALFDASEPQGGRRYSMPGRELWLDRARWMGEEPSTPGVFSTLRYLGPEKNLPKPPTFVALSGFAPSDGTRVLPLSANEEPVLADLMDADIESSRPFFEQMFPMSPPPELGIEGALRGGLTTLERWPDDLRDRVDQPFWRFLLPDALRQNDERVALDEITEWSQRPVARIASMDAMRQRVASEHDAWALRTALVLRRFADERFTPVHTRMLGALVQILEAPETLTVGQNGPGVSASGKGQTDSQARQDEIAAANAAVELSLDRLRLDVLPPDVVVRALLRLSEHEGLSASSEVFHKDFIKFVQEGIATSLRQTGKRAGTRVADDAEEVNCRASVPDSLSLTDIDAWSKACAAPALRVTVTDQVRRGVLRAMLQQIRSDSTQAFELEQTRLLLDHVSATLGATLQLSVEGLTPKAAEEAAQAAWVATLERHGRPVKLAEVDLGAPNPLAVCGKLEREAALDEASIKGIKLDLIVEASEGLDTADQVLWDVGVHAPFLMVDGALGVRQKPAVARRELDTRPGPTAERLFNLPGHRAAYRVRWTLWSGWHLLWGLSELELHDKDGHPLNRLALRTARLCEDTTLAPEDLVPTLVRAGLLEDGFRPSYLSTDAPSPREEATDQAPQLEQKTQRSNDELLEGAGQAAAQGSALKAAGENAIRGADGASAVEAGREGSDAVRSFGGLVDDRSAGVRSNTGAWADLNRLLARALGQKVETGARLTIVVFDVARGVNRQRVWRIRPRAPYVVQQRRLGKDLFDRGAVWADTLVPDDAGFMLQRSSPGYRVRGAQRRGVEVRLWRRKPTLDLSLAADIGHMPLRRVDQGCVQDSDNDTQEDAPPSSRPCGLWVAAFDDVERAQGGAFAVAPLLGIGLVDQPRLTVELGPAMQLTLVPPWIWGVPAIYGEQTVHDWDVSWRAGAVGGLRLAPDPRGLRRQADSSLWGVPREDGSSLLRRVQGGLRFGAYLNPGYSGLELTTGADMWLGWSLRRAYVPQATLTPFHPAIVLGPYLQWEYATLLGELPPNRLVYLEGRYEVFLGVRGQIRLTGKAPTLPEAP